MKGLTTEDTEGTEVRITIKASSWTKMVRERDELLAYLDAAHYATCNAELRRERDEAREEVARLRESLRCLLNPQCDAEEAEQ